MQKSIETTGVSRDAAIEKALMQLGLERDDVSVEVLDNGKKGLFGFGASPARVRVTYEVPDAPVPKPGAPKPAPAAHRAEAPKPVESPRPERKPRPAPKPEAKAEPERPARLSHIDPADPRLTTPHLVKAAPPREEQKQDKPQQRYDRERPRRGGYDRERPRREPRPPRVSQPREEKPVIPVSPEAMEKVTAEAIRFISGLLEQMGIKAEVQVREQLIADQLRLEIIGEDMGPVIGRRGDTLDAIQYLTSLVMSRVTEEHVRLSIDTENYRVKRAESLERLARKMAGKAVQYRKPMVLEPMNPYERRIIHSTLQDYAGVTTYSTGSEPGRRVVIAPEGARRGYRPRGNR